MAEYQQKLDSIRVQTARMLEIYSLLRAQIERGDLRLSAAELSRLNGAIRTIVSNMRILQAQLVDATSHGPESDNVEAASSPQSLFHEDSSPPVLALVTNDMEAKELDEIVNAVLEWQAAEEGE